MTDDKQTRLPIDSSKTILLVDGSGYIYRAFHAIRGLRSSKGLPTNAAYGFTRMLMKLIEEKNFQAVVMFFDSKGPTFRHEIYAEYKANRPPMPEDLSIQIPYIHKITEAFNIAAVQMPGYEADDLIATAAGKAEAKGYSVVIVTADKDLKQLVTSKTRIWDPMKDQTIDLKTIEADGIQPEQLSDVMGLSGDASDNVPGVPGIGPKTALKLIQAFGSLEDLYHRIDEIRLPKQRENLIRFKDRAFLSKQLVTLDHQAPLSLSFSKYAVQEPDRASLASLFKELEFRQLQRLFPEASDLSEKSYRSVTSVTELERLVDMLGGSHLIAVDTETTSIDPIQAGLVGLSFSCRSDEAFYIPCAHHYLGAPPQLSLEQVKTALKPILEDPSIKKVGQNIKYDWIVLERHGIALQGVVFDTMLASYLINPSKRAHNLDQIALDFLNHKTITYEEVTGKKGKTGNSFASVPIEKATPYACEDADITLQATHVLKKEIDGMGLSHLMETVEMPLVPVLKDMEMCGITVNQDKLHDLSRSFAEQLQGIEQEIYETAGENFNINSTQQLGYILFEKLKLPVQKKTKKKTGYSTDVEVLTLLAKQHKLPDLVLRHRTLAKLKSTYADALIDLIHPETGRIHTSYNQTVTATGRLSSSDPNLQNIPIRTDEGKEIRKAFVPKDGWEMISADYSQIELRILAHYSNDEILIKAFEEGEDIHTRTAAEVFQVFPSFITQDLRRQAKVINFGIIYGMSPFGLSKSLGISQKMAKTYIDNYFRRYRGVKEFIEQIVVEARQTERASTILGRIRLLPDINSKNPTQRHFAERTAINTPIQGTAADLIKVAMIRIADAFKKKRLESAMLLSVHDELIFEVPPREMEPVRSLIRDIMENVWALKVPLKVNIEEGKNWADAH